MKKIDISSWNRKEHFEFFSKMKNPNLGLVANVNCTKAFSKAKKEGISFFAFYMHKSMKAVNQIPELKYRLINGEIFELEKINCGSTIGRPDRTFSFSCTEYDDDFEVFNTNLQNEIKEVQNSTGMRLNTDVGRIDLVRCTTIPWVSFTSLLHPTNDDNTDSVPKLSFGKVFEQNGEKFLPTSVEAHHGLVDGFHIGEYFRLFEEFLNE